MEEARIEVSQMKINTFLDMGEQMAILSQTGKCSKAGLIQPCKNEGSKKGAPS